jgi:hypothetical protein
VHDPLAGLADVPWLRLHHLHGVATNLPDRLRMLRSDNAKSRGDALTWLSGAVQNQGARFPVSSYVVPFLVRLVDDPATPDRESLLTLLRAVVLGDASLPFAPDFELGDILTDEELAEAGRLLYGTANPFAGDPPMDLYEAASIRWAADSYRAGLAHLPTYVRWLSDPLLGAQAAELVAYFPPSQEIVDGLIASVAPASANLTMGYLTGFPKVDTHLMSSLDASSLDVRMTAAVALAFRLGPDLPASALDLLVDQKPPPAPPGWDRSMRGFVTLALRKVGL